jgi:hypothetical protein|tara:strand:- start:140 stop:499 length:360 start_codon:yes stop_codon:yes gene_type:complete
MARPTKYTPELLVKANEYLSTYTRLIPSHQDMCLYLDISDATLYRWAEEKAEFKDILAKVKQTQFVVSMDGGLGGEMNANLVKLLMGKHGYSDKVDTVSSDGSMSPKSKIELVAKEFDV